LLVLMDIEVLLGSFGARAVFVGLALERVWAFPGHLVTP
jgi:hypothetical protein